MIHQTQKMLTLCPERLESIALINAILSFLEIRPADYHLHQLCRVLKIQVKGDRSYIKDSLLSLRDRIEHRRIDFDDLAQLLSRLQGYSSQGISKDA
jgi:hypothetical protein